MNKLTKTVKVSITDEDGVVLDTFIVRDEVLSENTLAAGIRDSIELDYNVPEDEEVEKEEDPSDYLYDQRRDRQMEGRDED